MRWDEELGLIRGTESKSQKLKDDFGGKFDDEVRVSRQVFEENCHKKSEPIVPMLICETCPKSPKSVTLLPIQS